MKDCSSTTVSSASEDLLWSIYSSHLWCTWYEEDDPVRAGCLSHTQTRESRCRLLQSPPVSPLLICNAVPGFPCSLTRLSSAVWAVISSSRVCALSPGASPAHKSLEQHHTAPHREKKTLQRRVKSSYNTVDFIFKSKQRNKNSIVKIVFI